MGSAKIIAQYGCAVSTVNRGKDNPAYRHGHCENGFSPEYHSWAAMIQRCTNPNRYEYKHYGGKGIRVCERWLKFENFLADMGQRPKNMTLDRINIDGDYTLDNCRWADNITQARNSKQVIWVEINGEHRRLVEWCEVLNISINTVRCRVKKHGWTYVDALTKPRQNMSCRDWHGRLVRTGVRGQDEND